MLILPISGEIQQPVESPENVVILCNQYYEIFDLMAYCCDRFLSSEFFDIISVFHVEIASVIHLFAAKNLIKAREEYPVEFSIGTARLLEERNSIA